MSYHQAPPYPYDTRAGPAASYAQSQYYGGSHQAAPPPPQQNQHHGYGSPAPYPQYPPYPQQNQQYGQHHSQPPYPNPGYSAPSPQPPYQSPGYGGPPPQPQTHYNGQSYHHHSHSNSGSQMQFPRPGMMPSYSTNEWTQHKHGPRPPPNTMQTYNDGRSTATYMHSTCQGKRKALLIGINYFNSKKQLNGCINDVNNMRAFLGKTFGYKPEDMVILTDDQNNPMNIPTRANIIRGMQWLVRGAQPNDSLFLHFSGHGGQTKDLDGDEADGYDETIYPVDYMKTGQIIDDQMHDIMVRPLQPGVRLTAIFDSCHSGTALDLPYLYSTSGDIKEQNLLKEAGVGLVSALSSYAKRDVGGVLQSGMEFFNKATRGRGAEERAKKFKSSPADVIQWSGSKDAQTSADDHGGGVMSRAFIKAMTKHPNSSYKQMLNHIRDELGGKYAQKPQLSSSHPIDTDLLFIM